MATVLGAWKESGVFAEEVAPQHGSAYVNPFAILDLVLDDEHREMAFNALGGTRPKKGKT